MKQSKNIRLTAGFTVIEVLLIIVIVAVVGGTGYYVVSQRSKTTGNNTAPKQQEPAKAGTIADIDAKNTADLTSEQKAEDDLATKEAESATAEASAMDNVGAGYETSF